MCHVVHIRPGLQLALGSVTCGFVPDLCAMKQTGCVVKRTVHSFPSIRLGTRSGHAMRRLLAGRRLVVMTLTS